MKKKYLPFFWDYQITEAQLREILENKEDEVSRVWAMGRLLESASYEQIWQYITLDELRKFFPRLKLKKPIQKAWQRALTVWEK